MQRLVASCSKLANTRYVRNPSLPNPNLCDVFISHRRIDTKKTISGLLHDHFTRLHLNSFLDSKSLKPGDRLLFEVNAAIRECSVGIAVFSPRYCDSYFCLHELMRLMENKKRIIPIFCNVKPSELCVKNDRTRPAAEIRRLQLALEEAKYTVGLTFDTSNGDWSEFLTMASDAVIDNLLDVEQGRLRSINPHVQEHICVEQAKELEKGIRTRQHQSDDGPEEKA
uniref:TIR domain-containing protein n=1 Tax=Brassica oleracea var. oleracea TaxID=109376 RepID=A0A0D3AAK3_BRAOL